ncbi:MAG: hypothetical protein EZS28_042856, partial [Streblomastix strix]
MGSVEHWNQHMEKDSDDDAHADSEQGFDPRRGIIRGVPKPGNKWRKILDSRQVNAVTNLVKFKIQSSEFIKQILEKQDLAITLDLEEAFHHIKVSSDLLPYFGFAFQGRLFTYSGLPFGYKNSPYHFNKVLSIAIRAIRQRWNIKISNY